MLFQVYGFGGINIFDIVQFAIITLLILAIINSIKQKFKHNIILTWLVFLIGYVIFPYFFLGIPFLLFVYLWYIPIMSPIDILMIKILIYVIFEPFATILATILSLIYSRKRKKLIKHIRAPSLMKSFPTERELIFISYATVDSDFFQIPKITRILANYPEINEILYWESDMHDDIYQYMDENLQQCKIVLLFCSKNSLYSEAVKMEWRSALKLDKKIIPIFVNPDDIPALLSTKLGIQYKENDPYSSIEEIYQMILKKLDIKPSREFTRYIVPKWITEADFEEMNPDTIEKLLVFDSDISSKDIGIEIATILQDYNFFVPGLKEFREPKKRKKKKSKTIIPNEKFNQFSCFAELKDDQEDISLNVRIQRISENLNKVFIKAKGKREWVLNEILKDINLKLIDLKSINDLIRDYSEEILVSLNQMDDVEKFLRRNLGSEIKHINEFITQYNENMIDENQFVLKGTQMLGKPFITVFIKNS